MAIFSNGFQLISLLIFILTFGALTLISQISQLRSSGIRLISGEKRWSIFLRPVGEDLKGDSCWFQFSWRARHSYAKNSVASNAIPNDHRRRLAQL